MIKLSIELVPKSCWFSNVRSNVSKAVWDRIRFACYEKAGYKCEICGGKGEGHRVECHEIWEYDDEHRIQTLLRFIALCPECHQVKHFGLAQIKGYDGEALLHLMKVNEWAKKVADAYVKKAFEIYEERSRHKWELKIGIAGLDINMFGNNRK